MSAIVFIPGWVFAFAALVVSGGAGMLFAFTLYIWMEFDHGDPFKPGPEGPWLVCGLLLGIASVAVWWPA